MHLPINVVDVVDTVPLACNYNGAMAIGSKMSRDAFSSLVSLNMGVCKLDLIYR